MEASQIRNLVIEHAKLVAEHAAGNKDVLERLLQIETELGKSAAEIAHLAVTEYLRGY